MVDDWLDLLLEDYEVGEEAARIAFFYIRGHYSEPGRYYHNLTHIQNLLNLVEVQRKQIQDLTAVKLAVYFHDVIYDTRASDNEEKSAEFAEEILTELGLQNELIAKVKRLVLATKKHEPFENDLDCKIFLDADLAILGAPPEAYERYAQAIRQEYSHITDEKYRAGRREVLEGFLQRPRIYFSEVMLDLLETQAHENLSREIATLS